MKYRHYQYGKQNAGRYFLTILLMLVGWNAYASSVNTIDTVSIAKTLDDVVNRVILETESGNDLGTGTPSKNYQQLRTVVQQDSGTCPHESPDYTGSQLHAVTAVENDSLMISSGTQEVTYDAEGRVIRIEDGIHATEFLYGPDGQRWRSLTLNMGTVPVHWDMLSRCQ